MIRLFSFAVFSLTIIIAAFGHDVVKPDDVVTTVKIAEQKIPGYFTNFLEKTDHFLARLTH